MTPHLSSPIPPFSLGDHLPKPRRLSFSVCPRAVPRPRMETQLKDRPREWTVEHAGSGRGRGRGSGGRRFFGFCRGGFLGDGQCVMVLYFRSEDALSATQLRSYAEAVSIGRWPVMGTSWEVRLIIPIWDEDLLSMMSGPSTLPPSDPASSPRTTQFSRKPRGNWANSRSACPSVCQFPLSAQLWDQHFCLKTRKKSDTKHEERQLKNSIGAGTRQLKGRMTREQIKTWKRPIAGKLRFLFSAGLSCFVAAISSRSPTDLL